MYLFVVVNCGVIVELLLEVELFGYEEGVFIGLWCGGCVGLFEIVYGGMLFFDEIGEMLLLL